MILSHQGHDDLLTDSKKLSPQKRDLWNEKIRSDHRVALGSATVEEIDELNILWASQLAMIRAIEALGVSSGHVLVDGHMKLKDLSRSFRQTALVKGDLRCAPISAASIVAKVARDRLMVELNDLHPGYAFDVHKGYLTAAHRAAIDEKGLSPVHRRSFQIRS